MAIDPLDLLKQVFSSLADDELAKVAMQVQLRTYPPNTILCQEGAYEHVFYLISDGEVIGEMAIIQDAPRSATVTTLTETTVLELDKDSVQRLLSQNAELAMALV